MTFPPPPGTPGSPPRALLSGSLARLRRVVPGWPGGRWLLVDVAAQRLHLLDGEAPLGAWPVSTAAAGIDAREGSGGTPPGVHRILQRIGDGAPAGMVFVSREPVGRIWSPGAPGDAPADEDLILTRVLTLAGLEDGVNRGPGVDSTARYIYLHGTNAEDRLGTPCSHGCVRMASADVVTLFDLVREGDPVVIS